MCWFSKNKPTHLLFQNHPNYLEKFIELEDFQLYLKNEITSWFILAAGVMTVVFTAIIIFALQECLAYCEISKIKYLRLTWKSIKLPLVALLLRFVVFCFIQTKWKKSSSSLRRLPFYRLLRVDFYSLLNSSIFKVLPIKLFTIVRE